MNYEKVTHIVSAYHPIFNATDLAQKLCSDKWLQFDYHALIIKCICQIRVNVHILDFKLFPAESCIAGGT